MEESAEVGAAWFEQQFWLQVLGDHARFLHGGLAPEEQEELGRAACFIHSLDELLEQARGKPTGAALVALNAAACQKTQELRAFKLHLLQRQLTGQIGFNLPPTFVNHRVNKAEETLNVMAALARGELPPESSPLQLHLLWLQDATGHAGSIQDSLD